jgi:vesicular inhibitory amino acid transporter
MLPAYSHGSSDYLDGRLVPLVFLPLSILSYTSIFGICSTLLIIFVIFIDGFSKLDAPGSLWSPAATSWGSGSMTELGIAFGLLMAGVCLISRGSRNMALIVTALVLWPCCDTISGP